MNTGPCAPFFISSHQSSHQYRFVGTLKPNLRTFWLILTDPTAFALAVSPTDPGEQERIARSFRSALWKSFVWTLTGLALGLLPVMLLGLLRPSLPIDRARLLACTGAFLMAWPTWLALADGLASWKGDRLDELLRARFFKVLFFLGLSVSITAAALPA